jgi:hypothetical protein
LPCLFGGEQAGIEDTVEILKVECESLPVRAMPHYEIIGSCGKECYDIMGKLDSVIPEWTNRSRPICMAPIRHNGAASGENSFLAFSLRGAC